MMDVTMRENGQPATAEGFIFGLEWHRKHEPDANVSLNPLERDELLSVLSAEGLVRRVQAALAKSGLCLDADQLAALRGRS